MIVLLFTPASHSFSNQTVRNVIDITLAKYKKRICCHKRKVRCNCFVLMERKKRHNIVKNYFVCYKSCNFMYVFP